jgi:hypothetical protein
MKTLWRYFDKDSVLHFTSDIDEAERVMKQNQHIIGEVLHD